MGAQRLLARIRLFLFTPFGHAGSSDRWRRSSGEPLSAIAPRTMASASHDREAGEDGPHLAADRFAKPRDRALAGPRLPMALTRSSTGQVGCPACRPPGSPPSGPLGHAPRFEGATELAALPVLREAQLDSPARVSQRRQHVTRESHVHRFPDLGPNRRARPRRPGLPIPDRRALAPHRHRFRVDAQVPA